MTSKGVISEISFVREEEAPAFSEADARRIGGPIELRIPRNGTAPASQAFPRNNTTVERSLSRAVFFGPKPFFNQQLNSSGWPQFCDHAVTSADVRLSVGEGRFPVAEITPDCRNSLKMPPV